jgi:hypothetical protein
MPSRPLHHWLYWYLSYSATMLFLFLEQQNSYSWHVRARSSPAYRQADMNEEDGFVLG